MIGKRRHCTSQWLDTARPGLITSLQEGGVYPPGATGVSPHKKGDERGGGERKLNQEHRITCVPAG
ncbi:hypothetical protein E2C01_012731 [Portunus trituberculatus]|uniref:Uncharacterized protein n=1 Tax=Portunus trituberculatus TaxID=210409 RepID=A0A5B7DEX1_PORTR|nr:hypothetical protein [Portunus trituberculatus]